MELCGCPPEDREIYDLNEVCKCDQCDIDLFHGVSICRMCKLPKGNLSESEEQEFTYDENFPYLEREL